MYQFAGRIRYSETDDRGILTPEGILDYFQDCSIFHSEDVGLGLSYLEEKRMVWVLTYWQIVVKRYPRMGEEVTIGTMPYDLRGMMGFRNFVLRTKDGEELACANSIWTLLNTETGKPCRVPDIMPDKYGPFEKHPMEYEPRKIALPKDLQACAPIEVKRYHLDTNHHVNNGQYVRMAIDMLPEEGRVVQIRAEYKKSATLGDVIYPYMGRNEENDRPIFSLCDADGQPYAVVELAYQIA